MPVMTLACDVLASTARRLLVASEDEFGMSRIEFLSCSGRYRQQSVWSRPPLRSGSPLTSSNYLVLEPGSCLSRPSRDVETPSRRCRGVEQRVSGVSYFSKRFAIRNLGSISLLVLCVLDRHSDVVPLHRLNTLKRESAGIQTCTICCP